MHQSLARYSAPVSFVHAPSLADFITIMLGFKVFGTHRGLICGDLKGLLETVRGCPTVATATSVHSPDLNPIDRSSPSSSTCCARPPRARPKPSASQSAKSEHLCLRHLFPKLRPCPILKASCSSLRPAHARPAVRRRGPLPLRPRPLRPHQDLGAASCCP